VRRSQKAACSEARNREPRSCTPIPVMAGHPAVRARQGHEPQIGTSQGVEAPALCLHRRARHRAGQEEVFDHEEDVAVRKRAQRVQRYFGPRQPGSPQDRADTESLHRHRLAHEERRVGAVRPVPPVKGETRAPEIPVLVAREDDERAVGRVARTVVGAGGAGGGAPPIRRHADVATLMPTHHSLLSRGKRPGEAPGSVPADRAGRGARCQGNPRGCASPGVRRSYAGLRRLLRRAPRPGATLRRVTG